MILTVTPNAAVDKTYRVQGFELDRVNRPSESFTVAGGKGINVARVYQTLGGTAIATGFLGGINGSVVSQALAAESIRSEFVSVDGESRICIAIIDSSTGTQTEVNESGPNVSPQNTRDLLERVRVLLTSQRFEFLVMSGSLPPGTPASLYADLIEIARGLNVKSVLDSSGDALRLGLQARPWMIKPNKAELESLLNGLGTRQSEVVPYAKQIAAEGVEVVVVTLGAEGAVAVTGSSDPEIWQAIPPKIKFASAVASGDSFLAAFLWSWTQTGNRSRSARVEAALRLGTGAGAANAAEIGAGFCLKSSILRAARQVSAARIPCEPC